MGGMAPVIQWITGAIPPMLWWVLEAVKQASGLFPGAGPGVAFGGPQPAGR